MEILKVLGTISAFFIIDIIWIRLFAMNMYQKYIQDIMSNSINALPVILFYIFYPIIVYIMYKIVNIDNLFQILLFGFLAGVLAYGTYNLTNMGILKTWNWNIVILDTIWGGLLTMITMYLIYLMNK